LGRRLAKGALIGILVLYIGGGDSGSRNNAVAVTSFIGYESGG
jgi:hypothetical protein